MAGHAGHLLTGAGKIGAQIGSLLKRAWDKDSEGSKGLRLLVTGKTGEGKSTLVNGLLGAKVAVEGAGSERCTAIVEEYNADIEGVPVTVFDSPGLQDGTEKENEYLEDMKKKCQTLNLVLYCTKMTNNRLKDEDKHAISKLTHAFGQKFWKYAVLVLTFANREEVERRDERDEDEGPEPDDDDEESWKALMKKRFEGRLEKWKEGFYKFLIHEVGVQRDIVERILVVPAGDHRVTRKNKEPYRLPDRDDWFKELWLACILRVKGMKLLLQINKSRIVAEDEDETGTEVTADEEPELPEEVTQLFEAANENIQDPFDVQDSTLQLTDAPSVDETYTAKLQENIKKVDKEAWVKEQEKKIKKEKEEVERQAKERNKEIERQAEERRLEINRQMEERSREIERQAEERRRDIERQAKENERQAEEQRKRMKNLERQAEERRKESERQAEERRKESERQAEERRKESERQAEERRKESERQAEERRKESERQAEERRKEIEREAEKRRKEIEREAEERRKEIERQAEERRKENEKQNESDITRRKIALNKGDVKKVAHESIFRVFGRVVADAFQASWRFVTKPFRWFFSLF